MRRWTTPLVPTSLACFVAVLGFAAAGCPGSEESACGTDEDCPDGQVCRNGSCQLPSGNSGCLTDNDCSGSQICNADNECVPPGPGDATDSTVDDSGTDDAGADAVDADTSPDETPPEVTEITPEDGATEVDLNPTIRVTFSEPVADDSVTPSSVKLVSPNGANVEADRTRPTSQEVVLEPTAPLFEASPYRVVVNDDVEDEAGNSLADAPASAKFRTLFDEVPRHAELARRLAPWIYQDLREGDGRTPHTDIPTTVDFDGDQEANNNEESVRQNDGTNPPGHVYYHVSETETHYFLTYILYYPTRWSAASEEHTEHHFAGAVFVVERDTEELVVVDGLELRSDNSPEWRAFAAESTNLQKFGEYVHLFELSSSEWQFEDGDHFPMYVTAGTHETCHWYDSGTVELGSRCLHDSQTFNGAENSGVLMKPAEGDGEAQTYDQASREGDSGPPTMTYELVPFAEDFWMKRLSTGDGELFEGVSPYEPVDPDDAEARPDGYVGADSNHQLPTDMRSSESDATGKLPYAWESYSSGNGDGQWLLDPAYTELSRFNLSDASGEYSTTYCYNAFFGIDRLSSSSGPDCATPSGGDAGDAGDVGDTGDVATGDVGDTGTMDADVGASDSQ